MGAGAYFGVFSKLPLAENAMPVGGRTGSRLGASNRMRGVGFPTPNRGIGLRTRFA